MYKTMSIISWSANDCLLILLFQLGAQQTISDWLLLATVGQLSLKSGIESLSVSRIISPL